MKVSDNNAMRCPYMAGEMPIRPSRLCADCEIARNPAAAGDLGKHLNCAFLERKKKKASNPMKNQKTKKKTAKKASKRNQTARRASGASKKTRKRRYRDGYDGYYDDVLPQDDGGVRQGIDSDLAKKIAILIAGVLLIVGVCVAVMYYV